MIRRAGFVSNTVISKELLVRMRGWRWAGITSLYTAILGAIAAIFLLQQYAPTRGEASHAGVQFMQVLSISQLFLLILVAPASTAGAISGERRHHTWDLLLVTRLSSVRIVCGKLLAGLMLNLLLLSAALPLFALVLLFGGVTPASLIHAYVVFLATVLLLGSAGLAVSSCTARPTVSFIVSLGIGLFLTVGLSILAIFLTGQGEAGVLDPAGWPFGLSDPSSTLNPMVQVDPLIALFSALPASSGGTLLGDVGLVRHAFALPWALPLWGAYALISGLFSVLLIVGTARLVHSAPQWYIAWRRS